MGAPFFHEFKKQASFFFKEKIRTARLALTDVTPSELLTEEATNGNPGAPDARTLKIISRAAFEVDDYWRIVDILHTRLVRFDRKNWRPSYKALILLEHLLTHGPESVAEEFQTHKDVIREMESFQHIDEKGFNWGLSVRKKSEMILKLLEKGPVLKAERVRARKLTRGIEGFGSFCQRTTYGLEKVLQEFSPSGYGRSNSQFNDQGNQESQFSNSNDQNSLETSSGLLQQGNEEKGNLLTNKEMENLNHLHGFNAHMNLDSDHSQTSFKENMAPNKGMHSDLDNFHNWTYTRESKSLLDDEEAHSGGDGFVVGGSSVYVEGDHHPFNGTEHLTALSLLSKSEKMLEAC